MTQGAIINANLFECKRITKDIPAAPIPFCKFFFFPCYFIFICICYWWRPAIIQIKWRRISALYLKHSEELKAISRRKKEIIKWHLHGVLCCSCTLNKLNITIGKINTCARICYQRDWWYYICGVMARGGGRVRRIGVRDENQGKPVLASAPMYTRWAFPSHRQRARHLMTRRASRYYVNLVRLWTGRIAQPAQLNLLFSVNLWLTMQFQWLVDYPHDDHVDYLIKRMLGGLISVTILIDGYSS